MSSAEEKVYRTALRHLGLLLGGCAVLGSALGGALFGLRGVWGALLGTGLAALFCLTTVWSVRHTINAPPTVMGAWVFGTWALKMLVLILVLAWLRGQDFYHPGVLLAVTAVGAIGSAVLDARAVLRGRIPYVDS